ncbi:mechanosensitive ion channel family protein [Candidatus Hepatincolaceae symbiont of Richtersius coronifer]
MHKILFILLISLIWVNSQSSANALSFSLFDRIIKSPKANISSPKSNASSSTDSPNEVIGGNPPANNLPSRISINDIRELINFLSNTTQVSELIQALEELEANAKKLAIDENLPVINTSQFKETALLEIVKAPGVELNSAANSLEKINPSSFANSKLLPPLKQITTHYSIKHLTQLLHNSIKSLQIGGYYRDFSRNLGLFKTSFKNLKDFNYLSGLGWVLWLGLGIGFILLIEAYFKMVWQNKKLNRLSTTSVSKIPKYSPGVSTNSYKIIYKVALRFIKMLVVKGLMGFIFPKLIALCIVVMIIILFSNESISAEIPVLLLDLTIIRIGCKVLSLLLNYFHKLYSDNRSYFVELHRHLQILLYSFAYAFFAFFCIDSFISHTYGSTYYIILLQLNTILLTLVLICLLVYIRRILISFLLNYSQLKKKQLYSLIFFKSYYIPILIGGLSIVIMLTFFTDYITLKTFLFNLVISFILMLLISYGKILVSSFIDKQFVKKFNYELRKLGAGHKEFLESYRRLNIEFIWKFFEILGKVITILLILIVLDLIWQLNIINGFNYFYSLKVIRALVLIFAWFASLLFITLLLIVYLQKIIFRLDQEEKDWKVKKILSLFRLCQTPFKILIFLIMFIVVISFSGVSVTTLLASTGIITFLIALGSKDILQNFFNAILFIIEGSFSLNDTVEIAGCVGTVEDISMLYVKIRDGEGRLHIIPFSQTRIITNYNQGFGWALMNISVAYNVDLDHIFEILKEAGETVAKKPEFQPLIIGELEIVGVTSLAENNVNIACKIQTLPGKQYKVRNKLLQEITNEFNKHGIRSNNDRY